MLPWQPFLPFYIWGARWRHLKNTTEPSNRWRRCGLMSNYFDHLSLFLSLLLLLYYTDTVCVVCIESHPKMYLYSCHDSTLIPLLLALGCCDDKWPAYAADLAFELYEDAEQKYWVKIRYCGKVRSLLLNC